MINKANINICIPIETDEYLKSFIFKNINYRRKVYNDFIEEARKFEGDNHMYDGFKPLKFKTEYFKNEENNDIYIDHCVGISEQVANDITVALNRVRTENFSCKNKKLSRLQYRTFDKFYGTFKVCNKAMITPTKNKNISSRIRIIDNETLSFRVRGNYGKYQKEMLTIHLNESLYKHKVSNDKYPFFIREYKVKGENAVECWFDELGIKETTFIHKLGKFYIQLSIEVSYIINDKDIKSRQKKAGIDTGIHNPALLYYGNEYFTDIRMPEKISKKLHYLERRARRYDKIVKIKLYINIKRVERGELKSIHTKNYWKIRYKLRKTWSKIVNIKRNWIYTTCKKIVTNFQNICVDRFSQPDNSGLKGRQKHKYNYINRFHCMCTFNNVLLHMANKYGCIYVNAPEGTTKICSYCGTDYVGDTNDLSIREFMCHNNKCDMYNKLVDRDFNAARNCYNYL